MHNNNNGQQSMSGIGMMDMLKNNMMTMVMMKGMNGDSNKKDGKSDIFGMLYVFIVTQVIDNIMKVAPAVVSFFYKKYTSKFTNIQKEIMNIAIDITDNKEKVKTSSISITIRSTDQENVIGQSLLDFITNCKNTTHVSFINKCFILNQPDVICIDEDIYSCMSKSTANDAPESDIVQVIEIYSFVKTIDELRVFLDKIKMNYLIAIKNKLGNHRYYFDLHPVCAPISIDKTKDFSKLPNNCTFIMKKFQTNRRFHNLFGESIDVIRNRVDFFIKNKKWYNEKGIPYTIGLLLSGNPGTGKTSTIKCLANETNRHIFNINLNNDITKMQLENLFFNESVFVLNHCTGKSENYFIPLEDRIYVMEDFDCQSDMVKERALIKENEPKPVVNVHAIDLAFLLNLLDGVLENPGRIVVVTSNFPDVLDSALIRPGRIDVIAKFRNCSYNTLIQMIEFFYDIKISDSDKNLLRKMEPEIVTPAEMGKIMFENFTNHLDAIKMLGKVSNTVLEMKEPEMKESEMKELEIIDDSIIKFENEDYIKILSEYNRIDGNESMEMIDDIVLDKKDKVLSDYIDYTDTDPNVAFINAAKKFIQDKNDALTKIENKDHVNDLSDKTIVKWDEKDRLPSVSVYDNMVEMLKKDKTSAESLSHANKLLNDKINSKRYADTNTVSHNRLVTEPFNNINNNIYDETVNNTEKLMYFGEIHTFP